MSSSVLQLDDLHLKTTDDHLICISFLKLSAFVNTPETPNNKSAELIETASLNLPKGQKIQLPATTV